MSNDGDGVAQPPIERVVWAPLQMREVGDTTVVGYRTASGFQVLKRF